MTALLRVLLQAAHVFGQQRHVGGTDRLVGLLGAFLAGIQLRVFRHILLAVLLLDVVTAAGQRVLAQVGGVGTHVGDVTGLVQALGHHHGFLDGETQAGAASLLQRRRGERRGGTGLGGLVLAAGDLVGLLLQRSQGLFRVGLVGGAEFIATLLCHLQAQVDIFAGQGVGKDFPVFFGNEGADFPLPLHDHFHGNRLHPAGGQATGNLGPQQRRHHITHHPVEEATGLLGVDAVFIYHARFGKGFLDGGLGDFVEHHALVAGLVTADDFPQVPRNGFPFAVQVRCQVDGVGVLGQALQFGDDFFLVGQDLVIGAPATFRVHAHAGDQGLTGLFGLVLGLFLLVQLAGLGGLLGAFLGVDGVLAATTGGQVAHVADAGFHHEILAQVFVDGFRLGGRLHDDQ